KSVSDLIKSSFTGTGGAGGSGGGGSGGGASYMNSMGSGGSGIGSGGGSTGPSPRMGGGGYSQAPGTPPSAGPSSAGQSSPGNQPSSSSVSGGSQAVSPGSASPASSATEKLHSAVHGATDAAVRTAGLIGSLTVPGMEGAAGTSIGPAPTPPEVPDLSGAAEETPGNIIRPDSPSSMMSGEAENSPVTGNTPQNAPVDSTQASAESAPTPAVDTMSKLQQALNNQGKIT